MAELSTNDLHEISERTLGHYQGRAEAFWEGTRDHDVSQNVEALLGALPAKGTHRILDFGCGPGRDLLDFKRRGHDPVGLDGCKSFVQMAQKHSGAKVLHQNFLALDLPTSEFDGVFANASLFHVPNQELPGVLKALLECLKPGGVLFTSNPRGTNDEGWNGERYGAYHSDEHWLALLEDTGFAPVDHYYRPAGLARSEQHWLASLWRRKAG